MSQQAKQPSGGIDMSIGVPLRGASWVEKMLPPPDRGWFGPLVESLRRVVRRGGRQRWDSGRFSVVEVREVVRG